MEVIEKKLTKEEISELRERFGDYIKLTVDIENKWVIAGGELHADAEKILLEMGSRSVNIWGGGINLAEKEIDSIAVLNIRPRLNNDSMEILDSEIRKKFYDVIRECFEEIWH